MHARHTALDELVRWQHAVADPPCNELLDAWCRAVKPPIRSGDGFRLALRLSLGCLRLRGELQQTTSSAVRRTRTEACLCAQSCGTW
jgi:hypothetical protein